MMPSSTFHWCTVGVYLGFCTHAFASDQEAQKLNNPPTSSSSVAEASPKTGNSSESRPSKLKGLTIIGDLEEEKKIPGSTHVIDQATLSRHHQTDLQRVIWSVPGVYYQDEDGYGLRPNIGMRGAGVLRSQKLTIMEDGVLVAPAPYSAPAMHALPITGRMEAVEIRKGSSAIEYGPYTVGGAINLKSTSIPEVPLKIRSNVAVGERFGRRVHLNIGGSSEHLGWLLETYQMGEDGYRKVDGGGTNDLSIQDVVGKIRVSTSKTASRYQEVLLKVSISGERSSESYMGLSPSDFDAEPFRLYAAAQKDKMNLTRKAASLRHMVALTADMDITTTVYHQNLKRNWYKLEGVNASNDPQSAPVALAKIMDDESKYAREIDIIKGATSSQNALQVRGNNRRFFSQGVESILSVNYGSQKQHHFKIGARYHTDEEDRLQNNDFYQMYQGAMSITDQAAPGTGKGNNRIKAADAFSSYLLAYSDIGSLTVSGGARHESIALRQADFGASDPEREGDPSRKSNKIGETLPGFGLAYHWTPSLTSFIGTHRGFVPPTPGVEASTKAESSWNTEAGVRYQVSSLALDVTGFYNKYTNILGADTIASGGQGTGNLYNGGKALISGLESSLRGDAGNLLGLGVNVPMFINYTYTDARFESSFQTDFEEWAPQVNKGDYMPFVPHNQLGFGLGLSKAGYPDVHLSGHYQGRTRVKAGSSDLETAEALPERTIMDLSCGYNFAEGQRLYVDVRNLTNLTYIAARRPAGVRPGMPRTLWAGISLNL